MLQLSGLYEALTVAVLDGGARGTVVRCAGVLAVMVTSVDLRPADAVTATRPPEPHRSFVTQ